MLRGAGGHGDTRRSHPSFLPWACCPPLWLLSIYSRWGRVAFLGRTRPGPQHGHRAPIHLVPGETRGEMRGPGVGSVAGGTASTRQSSPRFPTLTFGNGAHMHTARAAPCTHPPAQQALTCRKQSSPGLEGAAMLPGALGFAARPATSPSALSRRPFWGFGGLSFPTLFRWPCRKHLIGSGGASPTLTAAGSGHGGLRGPFPSLKGTQR